MIAVEQLEFAYGATPFRLHVPELQIDRGQKAALIGPSGVGKTTLAYLIAGIFTPAAGTIRIDDVEISAASDARRRDWRISQVGFVFQEFELLEYLSVRENILLPYRLNGTLKLTADVRRRADTLAESLGLGDKLRRRPRTLSQGEKQRVAICRALITSPKLIIADEPTGNLDPTTAETIMDLLLSAVTEREATLLMVTHNHALLDRFDRVIDLGTFARGAAS